MTITLLSDYGLQDYTPGIAKGILLQELPGVNLVDFSHDISPHHLLQCSYFLKSAYHYFPKATIHLSLFNLFERPQAQALLAVIKEQFIISADNGLLPLTFGNDLQKVFALGQPSDNFEDWLRGVARFIAAWRVKNFDLSGLRETTPRREGYSFEPYTTADSISCQIIHIDRFGNVVLNLSEAFFEQQRQGRQFRISFSRNNLINHLSRHYSDVPEGEKLCRFNVGGFMEIAVNKGSAAQLFGFTLMREHQLVYQKIKINFL